MEQLNTCTDLGDKTGSTIGEAVALDITVRRLLDLIWHVIRWELGGLHAYMSHHAACPCTASSELALHSVDEVAESRCLERVSPRWQVAIPGWLEIKQVMHNFPSLVYDICIRLYSEN